MIIVNGFISGILTILYLLIDNWYWLFGIIFFVGCAILENKEISQEFEDDERQVL